LNREVHYLARKTLFKHPLMDKFLHSVNVIPIDQERPDMTGLRRVIKLLQAGEVVVLYPEGARSWDGTLQPGLPGAGLVAVKAGVPIVPMRLFGTYEILPRGGSKIRYHPVRIAIGKPFTLPDGRDAEDKKEFYQWASQQMMQAIGALS
jgi:1-acyl-sn-glycerol-3-phosphate acyltransferase